MHHWDGLTRFLDDGRVELETRSKEASPATTSAELACIASLIETCKLNGVDPQAYFADVLTRLVDLWPAARLDELMPWTWAAGLARDKLAA